MRGRLDRSDERTDRGIFGGWGIGVLVLPFLVVAFLVELAITKPNVSRWISEAEQAAFATSGQAIGGIPAEVEQTARPVDTVGRH